MSRFSLASITICLALVAGSGCATGAGAPGAPGELARLQPLEPRGPGAVFATVDSAALDGLLLAYLESEKSDRPSRRLARGSTVFPVEGGYSYSPLATADPDQPGRVPLVLKPGDVAHFHTYPRGSSRINRINEKHSPNDRANVDRRDPLKRPSFVLTPSLRVQRYDGRSSEKLVARIDPQAPGVVVAQVDR